MSIKLLPLNHTALVIFIFLFLASQPLARAETGKEIFQNKACVACHTIGMGKLAGPDLLGVTKRREKDWIKKWLKSPETMILTDPIAKELLKEYFVPMPNQGLNDQEIESLIKFFEENDEKADDNHENDKHENH